MRKIILFISILLLIQVTSYAQVGTWKEVKKARKEAIKDFKESMQFGITVNSEEPTVGIQAIRPEQLYPCRDANGDPVYGCKFLTDTNGRQVYVKAVSFKNENNDLITTYESVTNNSITYTDTLSNYFATFGGVRVATSTFTSDNNVVVQSGDSYLVLPDSTTWFPEPSLQWIDDCYVVGGYKEINPNGNTRNVGPAVAGLTVSLIVPNNATVGTQANYITSFRASIDGAGSGFFTVTNTTTGESSTTDVQTWSGGSTVVKAVVFNLDKPIAISPGDLIVGVSSASGGRWRYNLTGNQSGLVANAIGSGVNGLSGHFKGTLIADIENTVTIRTYEDGSLGTIDESSSPFVVNPLGSINNGYVECFEPYVPVVLDPVITSACTQEELQELFGNWTTFGNASALTYGYQDGMPYASFVDNSTTSFSGYQSVDLIPPVTGESRIMTIRYFKNSDTDAGVFRLASIGGNYGDVKFNYQNTNTVVENQFNGINPEVISSREDALTIEHTIKFNGFDNLANSRFDFYSGVAPSISSGNIATSTNKLRITSFEYGCQSPFEVADFTESADVQIVSSTTYGMNVILDSRNAKDTTAQLFQVYNPGNPSTLFQVPSGNTLQVVADGVLTNGTLNNAVPNGAQGFYYRIGNNYTLVYRTLSTELPDVSNLNGGTQNLNTNFLSGLPDRVGWWFHVRNNPTTFTVSSGTMVVTVDGVDVAAGVTSHVVPVGAQGKAIRVNGNYQVMYQTVATATTEYPNVNVYSSAATAINMDNVLTARNAIPNESQHFSVIGTGTRPFTTTLPINLNIDGVLTNLPANSTVTVPSGAFGEYFTDGSNIWFSYQTSGSNVSIDLSERKGQTAIMHNDSIYSMPITEIDCYEGNSGNFSNVVDYNNTSVGTGIFNTFSTTFDPNVDSYIDYNTINDYGILDSLDAKINLTLGFGSPTPTPAEIVVFENGIEIATSSTEIIGFPTDPNPVFKFNSLILNPNSTYRFTVKAAISFTIMFNNACTSEICYKGSSNSSISGIPNVIFYLTSQLNNKYNVITYSDGIDTLIVASEQENPTDIQQFQNITDLPAGWIKCSDVNDLGILTASTVQQSTTSFGTDNNVVVNSGDYYITLNDNTTWADPSINNRVDFTNQSNSDRGELFPAELNGLNSNPAQGDIAYGRGSGIAYEYNGSSWLEVQGPNYYNAYNQISAVVLPNGINYEVDSDYSITLLTHANNAIDSIHVDFVGRADDYRNIMVRLRNNRAAPLTVSFGTNFKATDREPLNTITIAPFDVVMLEAVMSFPDVLYTDISNTVDLSSIQSANLFNTDLTLNSSESREHTLDGVFYAEGFTGVWAMDFNNTSGEVNQVYFDNTDLSLISNSAIPDNSTTKVGATNALGNGTKSEGELTSTSNAVATSKAGIRTTINNDDTGDLFVYDGNTSGQTNGQILTLVDASTGEAEWQNAASGGGGDGGLIVTTVDAPTDATGTISGDEIVSSSSGARYRSNGTALELVERPNGLSTTIPNVLVNPSQINMTTNSTVATIVVGGGSIIVNSTALSNFLSGEIVSLQVNIQDATIPTILEFDKDKFYSSSGEILKDKRIELPITSATSTVLGGTVKNFIFQRTALGLQEITSEANRDNVISGTTNIMHTFTSSGVNYYDVAGQAINLTEDTPLITDNVYEIYVPDHNGSLFVIGTGITLNYYPLHSATVMTLTNPDRVSISAGSYHLIKKSATEYEFRKLMAKGNMEPLRITSSGFVNVRDIGHGTTMVLGETTTGNLIPNFNLTDTNDIAIYDVKITENNLANIGFSSFNDDIDNVIIDANGVQTTSASTVFLSSLGTNVKRVKIIADGRPGIRNITIVAM